MGDDTPLSPAQVIASALRGLSIMRCSRPLTAAEQRQWLAGAYGADIDSWTGLAREHARYIAGDT